MKRRWYLWIVVSLVPLLSLCRCGEDKGTKVTAEKLIEQGWAKFEAGNFNGASADFNAALGLDAEAHDAYLGLGWAQLRQNHAGLAEDAFIDYLFKVFDSNDAKAGLAFAYDAQDKFQNAISMAEEVLGSAPTWTFSPRDPEINHLDLAYVLADSYCLIGNFSKSLALVQQYFDPNFVVDPNTSEGRDQLAAKLESLYTG